MQPWDTTYEKVEFVLEAPAPIDVPSVLRFQPATGTDGEQRLLDAVTVVVAASLDRADQRSVAIHGAEGAARRYLRPDPSFEFDRSWWHLAYASDGSVVGFTQPTLFRGCARGNLQEGTIHYIGVVPDARGRGHLHALLLHATATLQSIGVWQISCDTDVENVPMIRAFERAGYRRGRTRATPFHD
jgi:ribosomal protein S18 acetylase RimI-like enzyme